MQLSHRLIFRNEENGGFIRIENTDLLKDLGESEKNAAKKTPKLLLYGAVVYLECALPSLYGGKC